MDLPTLDEREHLNDDDDAESYMDEEDVREVRLHHWLSETSVNARLALESAPALARADSPLLLGFDHHLPQPQPQPQEVDSNKPLPDLPTPFSRLRSHSAAASTTLSGAGLSAGSAIMAGVVPHRRSPSHSQFSSTTHSPALSRRPSLARQPSLPLLAESAPIPCSPPPQLRHRSSRLRSISSSLSLSSGRNAVYIDSEEVRSRLDQLLIEGNPEIGHVDFSDLELAEYYATSFEKEQETVPAGNATPLQSQGVPPNTPMTAFFKTLHASSSQIYLGKAAPPSSTHADEDARSEDSCIHIPTASFRRKQSDADVMDHEDVRSTPVPHGRYHHQAQGHSTSAISTSSSSSGSVEGSALFGTITSSTSRTSSGASQFSMGSPQIPHVLSPKASLASLSKAVVSPKTSLNSIGLGYQNHVSSPNPGMLSPPAATASRWSLTSSMAGDVEKEKKKKGKKEQKERGGTRKRLVSLISKIAGNNTGKEAKEDSDPGLVNQQDEHILTTVSTRDEESEVPPLPVPVRPKIKPPTLRLTLSASVTNLRSTLSSQSSPSDSPLSPIKSNPIIANTTSLPRSSTVVPPFSPTSPSLSLTTDSLAATPTSASPSARLSVSTSVTTNSSATVSPLTPASPTTPQQPQQPDGPNSFMPMLKTAVSVPAFLPGWESSGTLLKQRGSDLWGSDSTPSSPVGDYDDEDDEVDEIAEFYIRELGLTTGEFGKRRSDAEEERKARLSVITDMLERDLKTSAKMDKAEGKMNSIFYRSKKAVVKGEQKGLATDTTRTLPASLRKSTSTDRAPSPVQTRRSASGPAPIPETPSSPPPRASTPSKKGFRTLAARMGISNSTSYTPSSPPPTSLDSGSPPTSSKRKSFSSLMLNGGKRKAEKRRLVISGVGEDANEVAAVRDWCNSLGEVRSMMKVKSVQGEVVTIGQGEGSSQNVWVVDFKKGSVSERTSQPDAKVDILGAGSVRLSWESSKPKLGFAMNSKSWVP